MPLPTFPLRSPWAVALACVCGWGAAAGPAGASERAAAEHDAPPATARASAGKADASRSALKKEALAEPAEEAPVERRSVMRSTSTTTNNKAAGPGSIAAKDPMDLVRERLAEKLGASKAPEARNPHVLRVVSRASTIEAAPAKVAAGHGEAPHRATTAARTAARAALPAPLAMAGRGQAPHWDYEGTAGPATWGQLQPEFSKCSSGTRQSPIDIRDGIKVQLDDVQFDYKPSGFRVVDNGHTVQVNVGAGNGIEVMGKRYELVQFHFHRPSEERINGRQFDMVAHLVHKDLEGHLAVIAVLLDRGSWQPVVQTVWNNLPLEKGEEVAAQTPINLNELLPTERSYYTYMGSLTTPPCSEGVLWMVMKTPVPISPQQVAIFSRLYPMNARPVQAAAGRLIKESN